MAAQNIPGRIMLLDQENPTDYNCGYFQKYFSKKCIKSLTYPTALWYNIIAKGKGNITSLTYIFAHGTSLLYSFLQPFSLAPIGPGSPPRYLAPYT